MALIQEILDDCQVTLGEAKAIHDLACDESLSGVLPAADFLREELGGILSDGRITPAESKHLIAALARVLPKAERDELAVDLEVERAFQEIEAWRDDPASDKQVSFVRELGGTLPDGATKGEASDLIEELLATTKQPVSRRQQMVLRFWGEGKREAEGRHAVTQWLDQFYLQDPLRRSAWDLWKLDHPELATGQPSLESIESVSSGIGFSYLRRVARHADPLEPPSKMAEGPAREPRPSGERWLLGALVIAAIILFVYIYAQGH